jgi:TonB family protein
MTPSSRAGLVAVMLGAAACGSPAFVPPPPSPERVYALSEVDERPEIVLAPPLRYPDDPHLAGVDGVVVVRLVIDTAGNPEPATAHVVQTDDSALGRAGAALALKTLFRPARVRGRVVQVLVDLPVEFSSAARPPVTIHVAGDVYGVGDVQDPPHQISSPMLAYPAPLLLARVTGRVVVEAVIDSAGSVEAASLRVITSSDPRFNDAAKAYVEKARFTPGRIAGRAVRVRFQVPVEFKLPTRH